MDPSIKLEHYFEKEAPFKKEINMLRDIAKSISVEETLKWGSPVYTVGGKNVFWIARFKNHCGIGFFNGALLKDSNKILVNVQEGKTQAMRHWKIYSQADVNKSGIKAYMEEAIENQNNGTVVLPKKKTKKDVEMPFLLKDALKKNKQTKVAFYNLAAYKQRDYMDYIGTAKQEKTKHSRLAKIIPMINQGIGLNDKYRNS